MKVELSYNYSYSVKGLEFLLNIIHLSLERHLHGAWVKIIHSTIIRQLKPCVRVYTKPGGTFLELHVSPVHVYC